MNKIPQMAGHGSIDPAAAANEATSVDSFYKSPNGDFTIYEGGCVVHLLDSGKELECLGYNKTKIWMTEQQTNSPEVPKLPKNLARLPGVYASIETEEGDFTVEIGIDIAGEPMSFQSIGNLLHYALGYEVKRFQGGLTDLEVKENIARLICIIQKKYDKEPDAQILPIIAKTLNCTVPDALGYLDSSRNKDNLFFGATEIFGEKISNDKLKLLLDLTDQALCDELSAAAGDYENLTVLDKIEIIRVEERILRCYYVRLLLEGYSPDNATKTIANAWQIPEKECTRYLESDRSAIG